MSRESITSLRLKKYISTEKEFEFPEFLRLIRSALNLSRGTVEKEVGISHMKIYALENGKFLRYPEAEHIMRLSEYYGIPNRLLKRKLDDYIENRDKKHNRYHLRKAA